MMREQIEERLRSLRVEFKTGQEMLANLESSLASVRNTLVRISGAIQILEEFTDREDAAQEAGARQPIETEQVTAR
jgi:hypothetical protein